MVVSPFLDEGVNQATGNQHLEETDFHSVGPPGTGDLLLKSVKVKQHAHTSHLLKRAVLK